MMGFDSAKSRRLLEASFERQGDAHVFHRYAWSPGILVSAEEREAYLDIPVLGSRRQFYGAIKDRPPVAPSRPYWKVYAKQARAQSWTFIGTSIGLGFWAIICSGGIPAPQILRYVIGAILIANGAAFSAIKLSGVERRVDRNLNAE